MYSSLEQHLEKNYQRIDQILFIIKKCKLMINEHQRIFTMYLEEAKKKESINEYIIKTYEKALLGITHYSKVLAYIETNVSSPKQILDYIDTI